MVRWASLHHNPTAPLPNHMLPNCSHFRGNMARGAFCKSAFHAEVAPVPLAFIERMRNNSSLPRFLLPLSKSPWNLPSDFVPFWAMVEPVLFCAFLLVTSLAFTSVRPTNVENSLLHQPPSHTNFFAKFRCFQSTLPSSSCATMPERAPAKYPHSILQIHALFLTSLGQMYLISTLASPPSIKGGPCGHVYTPHESRKELLPSHLSPHLNFLSLLHARFSWFAIPFSRPHAFCPVLSGQGGEFLYFEAIASMNKDREVVLFCPRSQPFRGSYPHCMDSPGPCWHHARS